MDKARKVLDWEAMFDVAIDLRRQELTELHLSLRRKIHVLCVVISVQ